MRKAASLALDRAALADPFNERPTSQLLPSGQPGYRSSEPVPAPNLAQAKALMHGRRFTVRLATYPGCEECTRWAENVMANLARIGIRVRVSKVDDVLGLAKSRSRHFDLLNSFSGLDYPDPVTFLNGLLVDSEPTSWLPKSVRRALAHLDTLSGGVRVAAASDLADRLATNDVPAVGFGVPVIGQYLSPRIGCRVSPPFGYGIDLTALCIAPIG